MARISASTGIASGINIAGIVNQLMAIDSQPVTALTTQDTDLTNQQTAVSSLSALLLSLQSVTQDLGQSSVYQSQTATSSNSSALSATVTGTPSAGTYEYTPLQTAQNEQLLSSGYQSQTAVLGAGTLTYRYGNTVDQGVSLSNIDGGKGFTPGEVRITDRSGASAVVNLSSAQNIDDMLNTINNAGLDVTATTVDGQIVLTDNTSSADATSKLQVQEVGNGTTAASLGLAGIDTSDATATGTPIYTLSNNISLSALNDGMGIRITPAVADITYTLHDGTTGTIDLAPAVSGSTTPDQPSTLGNIVQQISAQTGGKLQVSVGADGTSLEVTDTTAAANPNGTLSIGNATGSTAASDLGLVINSASGGTVTGTDILGGLKTVLLSSLNGGQGLGSLGYMKLTDQNGKRVNVDLSSAVTLQDVVDDVNDAVQTAAKSGTTVGIQAQVNQAGDGIELVDTTGSATGTLTAANSDAADDGGSDGLNTAVKLGLATTSGPGSSSTGVLNSGDMHLRTISTNTLLSSLNGGTGVTAGSFTITNSAGVTSTINVTSNMETVGDVINAINLQGKGVQAELNSTGDGILLQDTAGGSGKLSVSEGSSTTAGDLNLLSATASKVNGAWTINGTTTHTITLVAGDTLTDLQNAVNTAGGGLSASILDDGSSSPYRLSLTGAQTGQAAGMVVDASQIAGMSLEQLSSARNALLAVGGGTTSSSAGLIVASSTDTFGSVLPGVSLQVLSATDQPVSVNIASNDSQIASSLQSFVSDYNSFQSQLTTDTTYDTTTNTGAVLSSDPAALELGSQLSQLMVGTFPGNGSLNSLAAVGITVGSDGTLSFDQSVLDSAWSAAPQAVQNLFTTAKTGVSAQFNNLINQLAGNSDSLLAEQVSALGTQITDNQAQITLMNSRLSAEQTRLYNDYYNMDLTISKLQSDQSIINSMAPLDATTSSTSSSNSSSNSSSGSSSSSS